MHIHSFGLKNGAVFLLQHTRLRENHWYRFLFLVIKICCFVLSALLMSFVRPKFCFAVKELEKSASTLTHQISDSLGKLIELPEIVKLCSNSSAGAPRNVMYD